MPRSCVGVGQGRPLEGGVLGDPQPARHRLPTQRELMRHPGPGSPQAPRGAPMVDPTAVAGDRVDLGVLVW